LAAEKRLSSSVPTGCWADFVAARMDLTRRLHAIWPVGYTLQGPARDLLLTIALRGVVG
jgi:hypothetical protein